MGCLRLSSRKISAIIDYLSLKTKEVMCNSNISCQNPTSLWAELNLSINFERIFVFLPAVFRNVSTRNGESRDLCSQAEPFAIFIPEGYARIRLTIYYYYRATLKALYFVMNNTGLDGKLTARLTIYQEY